MTQSSDQTNILRLYEELGVRPEQGVARLTERYRQRLRELHPDSHHAAGGSEDSDEDGLGWITRSYREALAFEREHGRLPGAGRRSAGEGAPASEYRPFVPRQTPHRTARPTPAPLQLWRWLVLIAALALLFALMADELARWSDPPAVRQKRFGASPDAAPILPHARAAGGSSGAARGGSHRSNGGSGRLDAIVADVHGSGLSAPHGRTARLRRSAAAPSDRTGSRGS